jgi:hypothetical protein
MSPNCYRPEACNQAALANQLRTEFAHALARITRAGAGAHGRANFWAPIQTTTKSYRLTNFLVWLVLAVIQTDPIFTNLTMFHLFQTYLYSALFRAP